MATKRICSIDGCDKPYYGRGWCSVHYQRWFKYGDVNVAVRVHEIPDGSICNVAECDNHVITRGLCRAHYARLRRHNDPLAGRTPRGEAARFLQEVVLAYSGNECLIWPFNRSRTGYAKIKSAKFGGNVCRFVCAQVNGIPPTKKHQAAHLCGKGHEGCVAPSHLVWKTPTENQRDRYVHGTHYAGERHPNAKLTNDQVREIRTLLGVMTHKQIGARFAVSATTIGCIATSRVYSSV